MTSIPLQMRSLWTQWEGMMARSPLMGSCIPACQTKSNPRSHGATAGKRKADRMALSMDAPVGDDDGYMLKDLVAGSYDIESDIFGGVDAMAYKLERYLARLSRRQKEVLELLSYCYKAAEIQRMLHITQGQYADMLDGIRCYENIKILL